MAEKALEGTPTFLARAEEVIIQVNDYAKSKQEWARRGTSPEGVRFETYDAPVLPHEFVAAILRCAPEAADGVLVTDSSGKVIEPDNKKIDQGLSLARNIYEKLKDYRNDSEFKIFEILLQQAQHSFQGQSGVKPAEARKAYLDELAALDQVREPNVLQRIGLDERATPSKVEARLALFREALENSERAKFYGKALDRLDEARRLLIVEPGGYVDTARLNVLTDELRAAREAEEADSKTTYDAEKERAALLKKVEFRYNQLSTRDSPYKFLDILQLKPDADFAQVESQWEKLQQAVADVPDKNDKYEAMLISLSEEFESINSERKLEVYKDNEVQKAFKFLRQVETNDHDKDNPGHHYFRLGFSIDDIKANNGKFPEVQLITSRATTIYEYLGTVDFPDGYHVTDDRIKKAIKDVEESKNFLVGSGKDKYDSMLADKYDFSRAIPSAEETADAELMGRKMDCNKKSKGLWRTLVEGFNSLPLVKKYVSYFYNTDKGNLIRGFGKALGWGLPGLGIIAAGTGYFIAATAALTPIGWPFLGLCAAWYLGIGMTQTGTESFIKVYTNLIKIRKRGFDDILANLVERPIDSKLFLTDFRHVINEFICRVHWPKQVEEELRYKLGKMRDKVDKGVYADLGEIETIARDVISLLAENPVYSTFDVREQMLGIDEEIKKTMDGIQADIDLFETKLARDGTLTQSEQEALQACYIKLEAINKKGGNVKKNLSMRLIAAIELELKTSKLFKLDVGGENLGIMDVENKKKVLQGDLNELVQRWSPQKSQNFEGLEEQLDSVGGQLAHLEYFFPLGFLAHSALRLRQIPITNPLIVRAQ